ncbi:hypothetical protein HMPREF3213_01275 [Heyndrickxia coagulans]|uniref:Uncharacterized protein n=1 Tax=Heyndrickxia coagulans TaxID=1398 RepID=A0A133KUZ0_HEYCO|nr:hypothetical protein HMPREF3213_01275 [Heyndrickxia coagulans]
MNTRNNRAGIPKKTGLPSFCHLFRPFISRPPRLRLPLASPAIISGLWA